MIILKSKLLREQIKHWTALAALFAWAVTASLWAISKEEKIILIAVEPGGTRLVTDEKDRVLERELTNFIRQFVETYYQYSSETFLSQVGKATDLFTEKLFQEKQTELFKINENLKIASLNQTVEIQSIDKVMDDTYEVILKVFVKDRLRTHQVTLKVQLELKNHERTSKNPYQFEIEALHETQQ